MMSLSFDQGTSEVAYSFNDETSALYWSLPPEFHGNKVCILKFNLAFYQCDFKLLIVFTIAMLIVDQ